MERERACAGSEGASLYESGTFPLVGLVGGVGGLDDQALLTQVNGRIESHHHVLPGKGGGEGDTKVKEKVTGEGAYNDFQIYDQAC